ncbi:hypothetical protein GcM3_206032, partial [Golovinomyces cichoracearum]
QFSSGNDKKKRNKTGRRDIIASISGATPPEIRKMLDNSSEEDESFSKGQQVEISKIVAKEVAEALKNFNFSQQNDKEKVNYQFQRTEKAGNSFDKNQEQREFSSRTKMEFSTEPSRNWLFRS